MLQDEGLVNEVWEELKDLRTRGIGRLDEPKRSTLKYLALPRLEEAAQRVRDYRPNLTRIARMNLLLKHEVDKIQAKAVRDQLTLSFGLRDDLDNTDTKRLRIMAATMAHESETNYSRTPGTETSNLWTLAVQIVADCFSDETGGQLELPPATGANVSTELATVRDIAATLRNPPAVRVTSGTVSRQAWQERMPKWPNPYVPRATHHGEIKRLLAAHRRALLVGLPGMGKSRLAAEVAIEVAEEIGGEAIQFRGTTDGTLLLDMENELIKRGVTVTDGSEVIREFGKMAEITEPSPVIVIDNLEDASLLDRILPQKTRAMIIITARTCFLDADQWPAIEVNEMPIDEARTLARTQLPPGTTDEEVDRFAAALAGYPLAIMHGAALLRSPLSISVDDFCRELARDASRPLQSAPPGQQALTFIYRSMLNHLKLAHAQAAELLKLMAQPTLMQLPQTLMAEAFEALPRHHPGTAANDYDRIEFGLALQLLKSYLLVTALPDDLSIGIHQLVQQLIRSLTRGESSAAADALTETANQWLRQHATDHDRVTVADWLPTIHALVNAAQGRTLLPKTLMNIGGLLGVAMGAAIGLGNPDALTEARQSWFFRWVTTESDAQDNAVAYVLYDWLSLSDSDYEPLAIARMERRQPNEPIGFADKHAITQVLDWDATRDQVLSLPLPHGSTRLVDPISDRLNVVRDLMLRGKLLEARLRAQSLLDDTAATDAAITVRLLLATIALRQRDVQGAQHYLSPIRALLSTLEAQSAYPVQFGRLNQLDGDMAHREYVGGLSDSLVAALRHYESAREAYWCEPIRLGRLEVERKLACVRGHASHEYAQARLRTLLSTEGPLYEPVRQRVRLSLAKLAIITGRATMEDYEACWSAARFYAKSSARDRYWYVESLVTAYIAGNQCQLPRTARDTELPFLYGAIIREAPSIGRSDRAELVASVRHGSARLEVLLAD
jgi:hypothetical protein